MKLIQNTTCLCISIALRSNIFDNNKSLDRIAIGETDDAIYRMGLTYQDQVSHDDFLSNTKLNDLIAAVQELSAYEMQ